MNTKNCKEELIEITTNLINENHGDVDKVTIRDITQRSGVSVGLINYHFGNKDNLISICVDRIISHVVQSFKPNLEIGKDINPFEAGKLRLINAASQVFDFFFKYPSISRISIISDHTYLTNKTNTYFSIEGFSNIIGNAIEDKNKKALISFTLTSSMQVTFLKALEDKIFLDYDFSKQEDRHRYIKDLVNQLMRE